MMLCLFTVVKLDASINVVTNSTQFHFDATHACKCAISGINSTARMLTMDVILCSQLNALSVSDLYKCLH